MTIQAVKFKDWTIPKGGRLDPWRIPLKNSVVSPFRTNGGISLYGRQAKPFAEKTHPTAFTLRKGCEADLNTFVDSMMIALLSGAGRLWFNNFSQSGPLLFAENAQPNEIGWTPNPNDWGSARFDIEWGLEQSILYRPLNAAYITSLGFTPITIGAATFGESWEERTFASFDISASPTNIVIPNVGQKRTDRIILRFESQGVNGAVNPKFENQTTEQYLKYNGTLATATAVLQANCSVGAGRVRLSGDSGASFVDTPDDNQVYDDCEIDDTQWPIMEFAVGNNNIEITADGTPDFRVLAMWQPAYGMI